MTRINDHDGCLTNPRSLALEVSLPGSSSVILLVQEEEEAMGLSSVRCEGRSMCPYSLFTFSLKHRDAAGAGWVLGLDQAQCTQETPGKTVVEEAGVRGINYRPQGVGTTQERGVGCCSCLMKD